MMKNILKHNCTFDDATDDSIVCRKQLKQKQYKELQKYKQSKPVYLAVKLKRIDKNATFTFYRTWIVSDIIFTMNGGQMATKNISFLIADQDMEAEPLLVGKPVLAHLKLGTVSLLVQNISEIDGTDFHEVGKPTIYVQKGYVIRVVSEGSDGITKHDSNGQQMRLNL